MILGESQEWKINRIVVVAQIKHSREAGAGEFKLVPGAVGPLGVEQIINATLDSTMIVQAGRHEAQQRPRGLRSRDRAVAARFRLLIAIGRFAPSAASVPMRE